jgi:prophage DNA circulation protein
MSWRDELQPASFRGVPFHVRTADTEEGRRGVLFEFPLRDDPYPEDLGMAAGVYALDAIVIGSDYFTARDALRDALKQPGPGELVHPTLGRMTVSIIEKYRFSESLTDRGGMAVFSLRFVQSGEQPAAAAKDDTASRVEDAADAAEDACCKDFAEAFSVDDLPEFVSQDAIDLLGEAGTALDAVRAGLLPDMTVVREFIGAVSGFSSSVSSLILTPLDLATQAFGLFYGLRGAVLRPLDALSALNRLVGWRTSKPSVPQTTPSRRAQASNRAAVQSLVCRAALVESARGVARIDLASAGLTYAQAVALRETLADAIEDEAAAASAPTYAVLMDLRAAVVRDITARAIDLPRLTTIILPVTLPALVAAYRAYGDATRDAELVARNGIRHPGFVTGGVALEVLA